jgi:hypothetical protein
VFRITEPSWIIDLPKIYSYKTFDVDHIKILSGGDVGNDKIARQMNKNTVSKLDPDVILIGGDIAYDNNIPVCYRAWDYIILRMPYQKYEPVTDSIRIIPFIFAAGNHDLGVNSYSGAKITHNTHEPVFKHYFPQNTENGNVPKLSARRTFFSHKIGEKLLIMTLDVGYESAMESAQKDWIENTFKRSPTTLKVLQYHGPILSACQQDAYFDNLVIDKGKDHWLPLFDKYNVTVVFENHTHSFKRTKRIKHGKEHQNGTYYLGEGSWGAKKPSGV